jgi:DNA invertase Pin-like site-specific DNA recombinase
MPEGGPETMRVIGYIRVSTDEQASGGHSLDVQRAKLAAYAQLYELDLVEIIEDAGVSAKTLKRPGLQRALALLRTGEIEGLVIAKLDRLTRSVGDWQILIERCFSEKAGMQLFSVGDSIDTRSAAGRLVLNVLLSVAQWEREAIGERTRDALRFKIKNGQRVSRTPRFGWSLSEDGQTVVEDEKEQDAIDLMREMRHDGLPLESICRELEAAGIKPKRGRTWRPSAVQGILSRTG